MTLNIDGLDSNIKVPFLYFGVDNSQAGIFANDSRILLMGYKIDSQPAPYDVPVQVLANEDALFGRGSMLAGMVRAARLKSPFSEIWAIPIEATGATLFARTIVNYGGAGTDVATMAETVKYVIDGRVITVPIVVGDTKNDFLQAVTDAANAFENRRYQAANIGGVAVHLTSTVQGNDGGAATFYDAYSYLNVQSSAKNWPVTVSFSVSDAVPQFTAAAQTAISNGGFDWIANPFVDATVLTSLDTLFDDTTGLWGPMSQAYGHVITAVDDSLGNLAALGTGQNNQHLSIFGINGSPTPIYQITAALAATLQLHLTSAPELSRPLQTVKLDGILPPPIASQFDKAARQALYLDGVGSYTVTRSGDVLIDRVLTTYKTSPNGSTDTSYQDIQTLAQLQYFIRFIETRVEQHYPRAALKADTAILPPGGVVVRPKDVRATIIAAAIELEIAGVIEDAARFAQLLQVAISATDPNCLEIVLSPDFVNQFRIGKVLVQFFLNYPPTEIN